MNDFWHDLPQPFFVLAPMEAVTDVVFRHVITRAGAPDIYFTEFTNATGWVHAGEKAIGGRLLKTDDEQPIVAQIWGGEPGDMEQLAAHCRELGYHGIDINMGCPAKSAIKSGGSALIRQPELAAEAIAAAKTAGLPVSVKTRLGYTRIDEWHDWLAHLLRQDIVNLTIHLRTKKEMSKVPAHHELIPEIIKLRDKLAPQTLLTINGDIEDRTHGLHLIAKYPGINGIMIGRGVFHNPFCFKAAKPTPLPSSPPSPSPLPHPAPETASALRDSSSSTSLEAAELGKPQTSSLRQEVNSDESRACADVSASTRASGSPAATPARVTRGGAAPNYFSSDEEIVGADRVAGPESSDLRAEHAGGGAGDDRSGGGRKKAELFALLIYHLELFDQYQGQLHRPFETLKRFFKIYIRDFDGASDLRDQLMHTKSTDEVRAILGRVPTDTVG